MRPLSALYDRVLEARARRYASGRAASERLPLPTVSVGNITVGGTGKTPFVLHLAERLLAEGRRPAILSRGYGRDSSDVVVVSRGDGTPAASPAEGGDEPVLLASRLPGAIVVVAPRRADAARAALPFSPDVFLLDDGFQHLSVRRDLDLVLLDARDPFGGMRYPPLGRLREPPSALARADALVFTRAGGGHPTDSVANEISSRNPRAAIFTARMRAAGLFDAAGRPAVAPETGVVAVSGIARPQDFRRTLAEEGIVPLHALAFPDHHRYRLRDVERIEEMARDVRAEAIVTTEKDLVKLTALAAPWSLPLLALRLAVEVTEPSFWDFLRTGLSLSQPQPQPQPRPETKAGA